MEKIKENRKMDASKNNGKTEKILVTAALPYVNNLPHLGNIVGSHLPADIFARFCRLSGKQTLFVGGTDENGTTTEITAFRLGVSEQELSDTLHEKHKDIYEWFNFSYDIFSRTSKQIHHKTTQEFFLQIYKNKYIIQKEIDTAFCNHCKHYLSDRYIEGTCPHCGYEHAKGDQCEKCGRLLEPKQLINPHCTICGSSDIIFKKEKHLFLDFAKLQPELKNWILNQKWRPTVKSMALSWIKEGLKPRCITRNLKWGVNVPIEGFENKVFYVWFDAPIGYISFTKEATERWQDYWNKEKAEQEASKIYFFVGKDNIPFHTIFFPGMIMANQKIALPYDVIGLQYLNFEGKKFSKSRGIGVFCENLEKAEKQLGITNDYWRFYLTFLIPENKDSEFFWQDFKNRINGDLIGNFANLINRTLNLIYKSNTKIKTDKAKLSNEIEFIKKKTNEILDFYKKVELRNALRSTLELSAFGNKFVNDNELWKQEKDYEEKLSLLAYLIKDIAILLWPIIPTTAEKIGDITGCKIKLKNLNDFSIPLKLEKKPQLLFKKIDDDILKKLKLLTSNVTDISDYFKNGNKNKNKK